VNISVGVFLGPANFHHKMFLMNSRLLVVVVVLSSKPCAQVACAYDNAYLIIVLFSSLNLLPAMQCQPPASLQHFNTNSHLKIGMSTPSNLSHILISFNQYPFELYTAVHY
jgi:hypothetical protein